MARLFFGMNQSLDGYVDHDAFGPGPILFRHFVDQVAGLTGSIYGRRLYEIMSYFDEDQDGWDAATRDFAVAWRAQPKWVVSRTLTSVGPNATLITGDVKAAIRRIKTEHEGEIAVGGPVLAGALAHTGLIDEYRLYLHPVVLGGGNPFFHGPRPRLRPASREMIEDTVLLTYVPV